MSRDTDQRVARAMGYRPEPRPPVDPTNGIDPAYWVLLTPDGEPSPYSRYWIYEIDVWNDCPHFTTDLADAWTLVDHLCAEDSWGDIKMSFSLSYTNVNGWAAAFVPRKGAVRVGTLGATPAAAIARAFLLATEVHDGN